jgi:hypothetical protein
MRLAGLFAALMALSISSAAHAQAWGEYINREQFFTVNFPGDPMESSAPYKTAKGTALTARTFSASAAPDSIFAGTYTMTVVDYNSAKDELATAMEEAAAAIRMKGVVKYDGQNMLDNHKSLRLTVEKPDKKLLLAEILVAENGRLYISEAETAPNVPPPAQYQASLQILDEEGVRIRYKSVGSSERVR